MELILAVMVFMWVDLGIVPLCKLICQSLYGTIIGKI